MKKALISCGTPVLKQGDLVHLKNPGIEGVGTIAMVFECVDIDNGYVVLQPLDFKRFNNDPKAVNDYLANKAIVKGIIQNR